MADNSGASGPVAVPGNPAESASQEKRADSVLRSDFEKLLFGVRRSVRYHHRRRTYLARLSKLATAITLLLGAGTVAAVLKQNGEPWVTVAAGVLVTVVGTINLVLEFGRRSFDHQLLERRFIDLEVDMVEGTVTSERAQGWRKRRLQIESEEPSVHFYVDVACHNELVIAEGRPEEQYVLSLRQRWLMNWFQGTPESIGKTLRQLRADSAAAVAEKAARKASKSGKGLPPAGQPAT